MRLRRSRRSTRTVLAGLMAGLAASFAMNLAMRAAATASAGSRPFESSASRRGRVARRVREFQELGDPNEEILTRAAVRASGHAIPRHLLQPLATTVHYIFGSALGVAYAVAAERWPKITTASGLIVGVAWWGAINEFLLPTSGLIAPVTRIPRQAHAAMLASHVVYGVSLEQTRRSLRGMLRA